MIRAHWLYKKAPSYEKEYQFYMFEIHPLEVIHNFSRLFFRAKNYGQLKETTDSKYPFVVTANNIIFQPDFL